MDWFRDDSSLMMKGFCIDQMSEVLSISRNEEFDSVDAEGDSRKTLLCTKITLGKYED